MNVTDGQVIIAFNHTKSAPVGMELLVPGISHAKYIKIYCFCHLLCSLEVENLHLLPLDHFGPLGSNSFFFIRRILAKLSLGHGCHFTPPRPRNVLLTSRRSPGLCSFHQGNHLETFFRIVHGGDGVFFVMMNERQ